ncbi:MAG: pyruvate kinase [bacterium]|nr:pyruvate kinase [bacterium]
MQRTKIIATIRDNYEVEKVIQLNDAGVDVVRINFTHATPETAKDLIAAVAELNAQGRTHVSILLDTKGPDIRTGVRETPLQLKKGDIFNIYVDQAKLSQDSDIYCDYPNIITDLPVGYEIIVDSGAAVAKVVEIFDDHIAAEISADVEIGSRRHLNLPGMQIKLPSLIEKDKTDILFGIKAGIAYVAASFIRTGENVKEIRSFLNENGGSHIKIISKIENQEGIENLEEIAKYSDGIMIARGDLGIELPIYELPVYQKRILEMAHKYGKPVIMATELMKSMVKNPFPTRAEVSDVFSSVMGRVDAVMLSDETAVGLYPIRTVEIMAQTVQEGEKEIYDQHENFILQSENPIEIIKKGLARHALMMADEIKAKAVIVFSYSGNLASYLSSFKPNQPVFSFTTEETTHYSLGINYGVFSEKVESITNQMSSDQETAIEKLKSQGKLHTGDYVIVVGERDCEGSKQPQLRVVQVW